MMSFRFLLFAIVGLFCLHPLAADSNAGSGWHAAKAREVCIAEAELAADIAAYRDEGKTIEAVSRALMTSAAQSGLEPEHVVEWLLITRAIYASTSTPDDIYAQVVRECFNAAGIPDA